MAESQLLSGHIYSRMKRAGNNTEGAKRVRERRGWRVFIEQPLIMTASMLTDAASLLSCVFNMSTSRKGPSVLQCNGRNTARYTCSNSTKPTSTTLFILSLC
ncbi:unnamed protein product [Ixodes persulcatus]